MSQHRNSNQDSLPADALTPELAAQRLVARSELDPESVRSVFGPLSPESAAEAVAATADPARASDIVLWLPVEHSAAILAELEPAYAGEILARVPSNERADLLQALSAPARDAIRSVLPSTERTEADRLLCYAPDVAGGLMETEFLSYPVHATIRDAIRDLRANQQRYAAINVQYIYIRDDAGRLVGVAPIRDLMLSAEEATLDTLIKRTPAALLDTQPLAEVAAAFDQHPFLALPVVNSSGVMLGVVSRADATEGEQEAAEDDYRVSQGIVGGDELRSMPVGVRVRRRGAWLGVNLLLCLGGAAVIAAHEGTIAKVLVVAAVLPVISATSGNAAMQAAAVTIREMTLGVIDKGAWRRVLLHELGLAALLAVPLGTAVAVLAALWGAGWAIGGVIGLAMALNTAIAVGVGSVCPMALRRFGIDPALASGPICTTLVDVSGFALTLTMLALVV